MSDPKAHPAADLFPMMSDEALAELSEDIRIHGQRDPVILFEDKILDGRNRWKACKRAKVEPKTKTLSSCPDPVAYVLSKNLKRRHLTEGQRAALAAEVTQHYEAINREKLKATAAERGSKKGKAKSSRDDSTLELSQDESQRSTAQAAVQIGAGVGSTKAMKAIKESSPALFRLVKDGKMNVSEAKRASKLEDKSRDVVVSRVLQGEKPSEALREFQPAPSPTPQKRKNWDEEMAVHRFESAIDDAVTNWQGESYQRLIDRLAWWLGNLKNQEAKRDSGRAAAN